MLFSQNAKHVSNKMTFLHILTTTTKLNHLWTGPWGRNGSQLERKMTWESSSFTPVSPQTFHNLLNPTNNAPVCSMVLTRNSGAFVDSPSTHLKFWLSLAYWNSPDRLGSSCSSNTSECWDFDQHMFQSLVSMFSSGKWK